MPRDVEGETLALGDHEICDRAKIFTMKGSADRREDQR
jgi:hypothetical protein